MASQVPSVANLIHVNPITDLSILPHHPQLHKQQASAGTEPGVAQDAQQQQQQPPLQQFVASALSAAQSLAKEAKARTVDGAGSKHKSEGYNGSVTCERWDARTPPSASSAALSTEIWAVRRSRHRGQAAKGDATYDELAQTVWLNHSTNERDYTPTVKDAHRIVAWEDGLGVGAVPGWHGCTMEIFESRHDIGPVLSNRVFTFLIITGSPTETESSLRSFVVLSIPIELPASVEGRKYGAAMDVVHGAYASVETVAEMSDAGEDKIEWVMATASDAKGNLPMALQKRFIKGEVAKDVGFVLQYLAKKRQA